MLLVSLSRDKPRRKRLLSQLKFYKTRQTFRVDIITIFFYYRFDVGCFLKERSRSIFLSF
jgi:hypothetical protein